MPSFPIGCRVKINAPRNPTYHGRLGRVSSHNEGEIGVRFTQGNVAAVWFKADELERLS